MSNLDKVFERNRVTKLGIDAMIINYLRLERENAALRDALSRLVEVHDAMGGVCGTVRIAAEEALAGKAQSEYICTCGIRVTPHKCPTNNDF